MNVTATNPSSASFPGAESPGTTISIDAGSYSVAESGGPSGYAATLSAGCSGSAVVGGSYTCTITNDQKPTETINQAVSQADPTNNASIHFTVQFSEPVTDFDDLTDVTLSGSASASVTSITPLGGNAYDVLVTASSFGTVTATVPAGVAVDAASNPNVASTSTDNTVSYLASVNPNNMLADVAAADADFRHIDGFDVLFGKGAGSQHQDQEHQPWNLPLRAQAHERDRHDRPSEEPGPGQWRLRRHDDGDPHRARAADASVGTAIPASANPLKDPAFVMSGNHAIRVRPNSDHDGHDDDDTDDMPVTVSYSLSAPSGDCSLATWTVGMPADGTAVKCIKIENFSIPQHGSARIIVNYEFRLKGTDNWATTAESAFRAGLHVQVGQHGHPRQQLPDRLPARQDLHGQPGGRSHRRRGQNVTAIGGFLYDTNGNAIAGATVKLYNSAPATQCGSGAVASYTTAADGFYFIWATGDNSTVPPTVNNLPSGIKYYVMDVQRARRPGCLLAGPLHGPQPREQGVRRGRLLHQRPDPRDLPAPADDRSNGQDAGDLHRGGPGRL